jgi:hypothetical protein
MAHIHIGAWKQMKVNKREWGPSPKYLKREVSMRSGPLDRGMSWVVDRTRAETGNGSREDLTRFAKKRDLDHWITEGRGPLIWHDEVRSSGVGHRRKEES